MEMKKLCKDVLCLAGMLAADVAIHVITAQNMVKVRRLVSVTSLSNNEIEIEHKGKREVLPLVIRNSGHLAVIWDSLKTGRKIHMILNCVVSKPHTKPTILRAEIVEVCRA